MTENQNPMFGPQNRYERIVFWWERVKLNIHCWILKRKKNRYSS